LDIKLFHPLAHYYLEELDKFLNNSQHIGNLGKHNFFNLFWPAFKCVITPKNILSGWEAVRL
ncbi:hypothetical protein EV356DRAFT_458552, partial [Viridothelium virens]